MTEQATAPGGIYAAMAAILAKVKPVGKGGWNADQKFHFRSVDQVMNELNALMGKNGVFLLPEVIEFSRVNVPYKDYNGKDKLRTEADLCVRFHFVHADGSEVVAVTRGEGRDFGDKATSKAHTMALKTMLLQVFMVPTADLEDPDATTVTDGEPPARQQPNRRTTKGRTPSGPDAAGEQGSTGKDPGRASVSPSAAVATGPDDTLPDLGADATAAEKAFRDAGFTVQQVSDLLIARWPQMAANYTPARLRNLRSASVIRETVRSATELRARKAVEGAA